MAMSKLLDLSQFPDLPPEVIKAFETQQAALEKAQFEVTVGKRDADPLLPFLT